MDPDKLAREWRESFEMNVLGGPVAEIKSVSDWERLVRDFDASLSALLRRVRDETLEETAGIAESMADGYGPGYRASTIEGTVAAAIRARGKE